MESSALILFSCVGPRRNWIRHLAPTTQERLHRNHHEGTTHPTLCHHRRLWKYPIHTSNKKGNQCKLDSCIDGMNKVGKRADHFIWIANRMDGFRRSTNLQSNGFSAERSSELRETRIETLLHGGALHQVSYTTGKQMLTMDSHGSLLFVVTMAP
jgi:hypothetical protein